jgi:hypothetical protein
MDGSDTKFAAGKKVYEFFPGGYRVGLSKFRPTMMFSTSGLSG